MVVLGPIWGLRAHLRSWSTFGTILGWGCIRWLGLALGLGLRWLGLAALAGTGAGATFVGLG